MASDAMSLKALVSVSNDIEASVIIDALADHGIRAKAVGGYTAGFRAEAPGVVRVVVRQADLAQAERVLAGIPRELAEIDWSTVDCGDGQPPGVQEDESSVGTDHQMGTEAGFDGSHAGSRPFQFTVATLLALQTVVSVVLALWKGFPAAVAGTIVVVAGTFVLAVAGTIRIGSDLNRARQQWTYLGRALLVGFAVLMLIRLIPKILGV